jgi:hypothetical protein
MDVFDDTKWMKPARVYIGSEWMGAAVVGTEGA